MPDEFKPIEKDIKDALTKAADDVETGYPKHLKDIADRAEKVVAGGTKKVDEENAASIKKILDDVDANKTRTDISASAKAAQESKLTSKLRSILDPEGETKRTTDVNNQINNLRTQGHGPQRHLDSTDAQLQTRLGTTKLDASGNPTLKTAGPNVGYVSSKDFIDPMTGTTEDTVVGSGKKHLCGPFSTKFDNPEDYARADDYFRKQLAAGTPPGPTPISDVLGPEGHQDLTGYYKDPANPGAFKSIDFEGGTITPVYRPDPTDPTKFNLVTMYPEPDKTRNT